ncbi:MAG: putative amidoligase domain-containing protein [Chloroflexota bacterium]
MPTTYLLHNATSDPPLRQYVGGLISASGQVPPTARVDLLIRWGNTDGDDSIAEHVLNRRGRLADAMLPARANAMLTRSGLHVHNLGATGRLRVREYFRIHALDLRLVYLGRREPKRFGFQEIGLKHSRLSEKAVRYACRALYALGLDFGEVDVIVNRKGKLAVLKVNPQPRVAGRLADRYAAAIDEYIAGLNQATFPNVVLGADPEFAIRKDTGQMVPASRFFPFEGRVGCDAAVFRTANGKAVRPLVELRPTESPSPTQLVRAIHRLLARAAEVVPYANVQFRAGSLPYPGYPIGGHIHFSGLGSASCRILRALDTYLAIPLFLVENAATSRLRRPKYGFLGDQRPKEWGFEYRTLASWLISPRIALATLSLAKVVAVNYRLLRRDVFSDPDLVHRFYAGHKEPFYAIANKLFEELAMLPTYAEYAADIAPLRQLISQRRQWSERVDIRRTWKLPVSPRLLPGTSEDGPSQ